MTRLKRLKYIYLEIKDFFNGKVCKYNGMD